MIPNKELQRIDQMIEESGLLKGQHFVTPADKVDRLIRRLQAAEKELGILLNDKKRMDFV